MGAGGSAFAVSGPPGLFLGSWMQIYRIRILLHEPLCNRILYFVEHTFADHGLLYFVGSQRPHPPSQTLGPGPRKGKPLNRGKGCEGGAVMSGQASGFAEISRVMSS